MTLFTRLWAHLQQTLRALLLASALLGPFTPAWSHSSSTSYLDVNAPTNSTLTLRIDLPIRDLALRYDLDQDRDGAVTWKELRSQSDVIGPWITGGIQLQRAQSDCALELTEWAAAAYGEESYLSLTANAKCPTSTNDDAVAIRYTLFFDQDSLHRGLIKASLGNKTLTAIVSPDRSQQTLDPSASGFIPVLWTYLIEGIWHIWIGADHILFLISLLLPCVFLREATRFGQWRPTTTLKPALLSVLAVVTAFTIAHSITLGLTVLEVISPPDGLVEPIIAISVIIAALANLTKTFIHLKWQMAFGFGLIHGFGFASVLADLGLPSEQLTTALLGFNLGVEIGQLAIVAVFFPLAWHLRATALYRWGFVFTGSLIIAAIAVYWLIERLQ